MPSFDLPLLQEKYVLQQHEIELLKRNVAYLSRKLDETIFRIEALEAYYNENVKITTLHIEGTA